MGVLCPRGEISVNCGVLVVVPYGREIFWRDFERKLLSPALKEWTAPDGKFICKRLMVVFPASRKELELPSDLIGHKRPPIGNWSLWLHNGNYVSFFRIDGKDADVL
jgi:hypothetical protein